MLATTDNDDKATTSDEKPGKGNDFSSIIHQEVIAALTKAGKGPAATGNGKGGAGTGGGVTGKPGKGSGKDNGKPARVNPNIICYNCGEKGHPARLCPKPKAAYSLEELQGELHEEDAPAEGPGETEWIGSCECCHTVESDTVDNWTLVTSRKNKDGADPSFIMSVGDVTKDGMVRIQVPIDSGATDCVMPKSMFPSVKLEPSEKSRRGGSYTVANGKKIPNLGKRRSGSGLVMGK